VKSEKIAEFERFLLGFTKKNGKKLGQRTLYGVLTLAKFLEEAIPNESLEVLKQRYNFYLKERNHPIGLYALWLYLKFLGYEEKFVKEIASFKRRNVSALTDEEKLAASVLSKKELLFLVEQIPDERDKLLVRVLYDTAARISEITNLMVKDIDLEVREIQVMGKGRKPRTVYVQQGTRELLEQWINKNRLVSPNMFIFGIKPGTAWYNLKKYGREILKRELHPHMLRHSRLQHMADEGIDSFSIKSYAGHGDIGTTQIYVKASKYQGKIAFDRAGDVWNVETKKSQS